MREPTAAHLQQLVQALHDHVLRVTEDAPLTDARLLELRLRAVRLFDGPADEAGSTRRSEHVPQPDIVVIN